MRWAKRLLVAALFIAALVIGWRFAERNADPVFVDYLVGSIDAPRWAVLLGAFGAGAVCAGLVGVFQLLRLSLTTRRFRKLARNLEQEVHQLRNLPLAAADPARGAADAAFDVRSRSG